MTQVFATGIEVDSQQAANQPFEATAKVNNRETVGPFTGPAVCPGDSLIGSSGHLSDVTLTATNSHGTVVWEETKTKCIPIEGQDNIIGPSARVNFNLDLPAGEYTFQAAVSARGESRTDRSDTIQLTVEGDNSSLPTGDDRSDVDIPFTGDDGDGGSSGGGSDSGGDILAWVLNNQQKAAGILLLLAFLAVAGPYANLAASATGGSS